MDNFTTPVDRIELSAEAARELRAADAHMRRCMDAAALDAARHKVAIGEAAAAGRAALETLVRDAGGDETVPWQLVGTTLVPVTFTAQES
jgi:hypothetical protein